VDGDTVFGQHVTQKVKLRISQLALASSQAEVVVPEPQEDCAHMPGLATETQDTIEITAARWQTRQHVFHERLHGRARVVLALVDDIPTEEAKSKFSHRDGIGGVRWATANLVESCGQVQFRKNGCAKN